MKKMLRISIFTLIALIILGFKADETPLEKLLKQLAKITASYPQEKVHLHFDKPYYAVGEDIWLKGYLVTAEKNEPSLLSTVLYVDLIDSKNNIKKKLTLAVDKGYANGNISLLDSLISGVYRVRAYTNYMRNYNQDLFFEKFITIGNVADNTAVKKVEEKNPDFNIQFFPEGGNLISGTRSKIGFKAVTADGLGANLSGYIINKNKDKVAEFIAEHAGMGIFALLPQANEQYTAIVTLADNSTKSFKLPTVVESGQSLAVNSTAENLAIRISSTADLLNGKDVFVVAQANGTVYASFTSKVDKAILTANIAKKDFPSGIIQISLFNAESKPIAERLVFVNHNDYLNIDVSNTNEASIKKRTNLALNVKDLAGNPIDGNFSVSVTDLGQTPFDEDEEKTILSNLLLTSDLKGYIEKPNYYFNSVNPDREKHLDYLLLTQGWTRFVWTDVITNKEPDIKFRPEQSLEIAGKITSSADKLLTNAKVSLISTTPGLFLKLDTVSDIKGNFVFDRLELPPSTSFMLQSSDSKNNKDVKIKVNPVPEVKPNTFIGSSVNINTYVESTKKMFQELSKYNMLNSSILLNTVEIKTKPILKPLLNVPNSANVSGAVDYVINEKMLVNSINMLSPFYKVPGVMVKNGTLYNIRGRKSLTSTPPPYTIILDGMRVSQDILSGINPADVMGIEVLSSSYNTAVYGEDGAGGVIHITSRRGGGKPAIATNTARIIDFGFSVTKQFYSPNYDDPKTNQQLQDLRSTIYWNPATVTNDKGQANLSFFNAGTPGNYRVTVEGMDAFGNIARKIYTYQVK